ncbi:MAG: hypothetical protein ACRD1F_02950, partial [Terriglobales bacterium]
MSAAAPAPPAGFQLVGAPAPPAGFQLVGATPSAPAPEGLPTEALHGAETGADVLVTGVLNTPHAALGALWDLANRVTGNGGGVPMPAWMSEAVPGAQMNPANAARLRQFIAPDVQLAERGMEALGRVSPTAEDVLRQAGGVAGDVANVLPMAGATNLALGAVRKTLAAVPAVLPDTTPEGIRRGLAAVGYRQLPGRNPDAGPIARVAARVAGEPELAAHQSVTDQAVTNALAAHESGVAPGQPVTGSTLEAAQAPHIAV